MSDLNLYAADASGHVPRADERFHWQSCRPLVKSVRGTRWLIRRTVWTEIYLADGSPARWAFRAILWGLQIYYGTAKCDGSRTYMLMNGQLGGTMDDQLGYVMTTTPSEMLAFRWRWKGSQAEPSWDNMGGA